MEGGIGDMEQSLSVVIPVYDLYLDISFHDTFGSGWRNTRCSLGAFHSASAVCCGI